MRTTIELSDDLLRRAKATAALRGLKLRELIEICLTRGLEKPEELTAAPRRRQLPESIQKAIPGHVIPSLSSEQLSAIEEEEDLASFRRSAGR